MFNLNKLAEIMTKRLAENGIVLNVSVEVLVPLTDYKDIDLLDREQKKELLNVLGNKLDDGDNSWYEAYCYVEGYFEREYYNENIDAFLEYEKKMDQPDFDWGFYSDWHKDMYGFRPR